MKYVDDNHTTAGTTCWEDFIRLVVETHHLIYLLMCRGPKIQPEHYVKLMK